MYMVSYLNRIKPRNIYSARRKQNAEKATEEEYYKYRSLSGSNVWAANGSFPQASFLGSHMQQFAPQLRVRDLTESNKMLKDIRDLDPVI